ncbi:MAG: hypothetical protein WBF43_03365 [Methylocella sp.]
MKRSVAVSACLPAIGCAFFLGGCAISQPQPVALIGQHGEILRGTNTWSPGFGGGIRMTNGKTTCSGSWEFPRDVKNEGTVIFPLICSDGRTGIATASFGVLGRSGGGKVRFSDGTEADFIIGEGARGI